MPVIQTQIRMLSNYLNKKIEENNYIIDDNIVRISQMVDDFIVEHEKLKLKQSGKN